MLEARVGYVCFSILDWIVAVGTNAIFNRNWFGFRFQYPRLDRSGWNKKIANGTSIVLAFQYPRLDRSGWNL